MRINYKSKQISIITVPFNLKIFKLNNLLTFFFVVMTLFANCQSTWATITENSYTLTIDGQGTCKMAGMVDNQTTQASIPLVIPKAGGEITGNGTHSIIGNGYSLSGKVVLSGVVENDTLVFPFLDYYYQGKVMTKEAVPPIKMKIEGGSEYIQDYPPCNYKMVYKLVAPNETWRVVYNGYDVLYFGGNSLAGGVKVHWRTTVEFTIDNGQYKKGTGKNEIGKVENYSFPPGAWDSVTLKGYPKIKIPTFTVSGTKNGSAVQLTLPKENNEYFIGYTSILDTDALKSYLKTKGYKKFPSLPGMKKTETVTDQIGNFPRGIRNISLANYEKVMESNKFYGYSIKVKKLN